MHVSSSVDPPRKTASRKTLLVLGASGSVGLTAVEIGKTIGATVISVARGAEKMAVAKAVGAHFTIEANDDVTELVRALSGADVVYDPVGDPPFKAALRATNRERRVITIGFVSGEIPQVLANYLLVKI